MSLALIEPKYVALHSISSTASEYVSQVETQETQSLILKLFKRLKNSWYGRECLPAL